MLHKNIPVEDRHATHNYEYADAAARTSATGFDADDLHKLALQLDDGSYWRLASTTPTWAAFGAKGDPGAQGPQGEQGLQGIPGLNGTGSGDMIAANNLSDLLSASAARGNLGLSNVNNTADADKPVSTAQGVADSAAQAAAVATASGDATTKANAAQAAAVATASGDATTKANAAQAAAIAASAPLAHVGSGGGSHANVIAGGAAGFMTGADKTKLDGVSGTNTGDQTPASLGLEIGTDVQAFDADTAKTDVAQTFTLPQRGTITTDNDGSFAQSATNNFFCTPTGAVALTFTDHTAGQSGLILFVNTTNYVVTAAATTYIAAADLTKLSTTGNYLIAYLSNGTNTYCTVTAALTSAGT